MELDEAADEQRKPRLIFPTFNLPASVVTANGEPIAATKKQPDLMSDMEISPMKKLAEAWDV
jgi:hypothetical protein